MSGGGCYGFDSERNKMEENGEKTLRKRLRVVATMDAITRYGSKLL